MFWRFSKIEAQPRPPLAAWISRAPVLRGLLIANEVVDIFIPIRFYWVRRHRWLKMRGMQDSNQESQARKNA